MANFVMLKTRDASGEGKLVAINPDWVVRITEGASTKENEPMTTLYIGFSLAENKTGQVLHVMGEFKDIVLRLNGL